MSPESSETIRWQELPSLRQPLAGQYVGVVDHRLVMAGGTYWTAPPNQGGTKVWVDSIRVLRAGDTEWYSAGRLPKRLAYGAAVSIREGMVCIGGQTAEAASALVLRLRWDNEMLEITRLPDLPRPAANISAALVGDKILVAGGQGSAPASEATNNFWALKLARCGEKQRGWTQLEPWPGPPRILAVASGCRTDFYLLSGADLRVGDDGSMKRWYLKDAFRYRRRQGWQRIADLPYPVVAAPSLCWEGNGPLVFGGDDGELAAAPAKERENHPGFNRAVLGYDGPTNQWRRVGEMRKGLVTTGALSGVARLSLLVARTVQGAVPLR